MKKTRNKALAVLDGKIELARQEHQTAAARMAETVAALSELAKARDAVAKAYERKATGKGRGRTVVERTAGPVAKDGATEVSA